MPPTRHRARERRSRAGRIRTGPNVLVAVTGLAAALPLAGCGTGDDREAVRSVVEAYVAALEREDGAAACAQLTPAAREELESSSGMRCREVVTRLDQRPGAIAGVDVAAVNAQVDLVGGDTAFLARESEGWRIAAAGCRPEQGKPADRPYACEVQA